MRASRSGAGRIVADAPAACRCHPECAAPDRWPIRSAALPLRTRGARRLCRKRGRHRAPRPRSVPFTVTGEDCIGSAVSMESLRFGRAYGLRFLLGHLRECADGKQQNVRNSLGRFDADGIDAGRDVGFRLHQKHPRSIRRGHRAGYAGAAFTRVNDAGKRRDHPRVRRRSRPDDGQREGWPRSAPRGCIR